MMNSTIKESSNLKMIYLANARIPSEKAHTYQILKMCEAFASIGIDVKLLYPFRFQNEMGRIKNIWQHYKIEKIFDLKRVFCIDLIVLDRRLHFKFSRILSLVQSFTYAMRVFLHIIRVDNSVIIYTRDKITVFLLLLFKKLVKGKIYYESHEFPNTQHHLIIHLFRNLDALIVITSTLKELYIQHGFPPAKIHVAPDGVDLKIFGRGIAKQKEREKLGLPLEEKIICYTGHLYRWKGVYTLADSAKRLQDCLFLIVGGTALDIPKYKEYLREKDISNVKMVGYVPPGVVPEYLSVADVVVLPNSAKENISKYYTSPLKLFEYMASQKPIVASDLPSIREILTHGVNAILVEPDNPDALAAGIKYAIENEQFSQRIASKASQDVKCYTWHRRAEGILEFLTLRLTNGVHESRSR